MIQQCRQKYFYWKNIPIYNFKKKLMSLLYDSRMFEEEIEPQTFSIKDQSFNHEKVQNQIWVTSLKLICSSSKSKYYYNYKLFNFLKLIIILETKSINFKRRVIFKIKNDCFKLLFLFSLIFFNSKPKFASPMSYFADMLWLFIGRNLNSYPISIWWILIIYLYFFIFATMPGKVLVLTYFYLYF